MFGKVDKNGVIRFSSGDIQECRDFLYSSGFECRVSGWEKTGWIAGITYSDGSWHAFARQS